MDTEQSNIVKMAGKETIAAISEMAKKEIICFVKADERKLAIIQN